MQVLNDGFSLVARLQELLTNKEKLAEFLSRMGFKSTELHKGIMNEGTEILISGSYYAVEYQLRDELNYALDLKTGFF